MSTYLDPFLLRSLDVQPLFISRVYKDLNLILELLGAIFLGYSPTQKGLKCSHPPTKKKFVPMDIKFFEELSYFCKTDLQGEKTSDVKDLSHSPCQLSLVYPIPNAVSSVPTSVPDQPSNQRDTRNQENNKEGNAKLERVENVSSSLVYSRRKQGKAISFSWPIFKPGNK